MHTEKLGCSWFKNWSLFFSGVALHTVSLALSRLIHNIWCQGHSLWHILHLVCLLFGNFFTSLLVQHSLVGEGKVKWSIVVTPSVNLGDSFCLSETREPSHNKNTLTLPSPLDNTNDD